MFSDLAGTDNLGIAFAMYTCFIVMLLLVAAVIIQFIGPNAKGLSAHINSFLISLGSGIPEMKCILSGVWLHKYLAMKVLVAKVFGMILACGCGTKIRSFSTF